MIINLPFALLFVLSASMSPLVIFWTFLSLCLRKVAKEAARLPCCWKTVRPMIDDIALGVEWELFGEPEWLSASVTWSSVIPDINQLNPFNSTCLLFLLTGVTKAQIWVQPLLASIPYHFDEIQLISIRIALMIPLFVTPNVINQKSKTFNSLFINALNAPVPPLSNDVCLKVLA